MKKYIIEMEPSQIKNFNLDYQQIFEEVDFIEGKKLLKLDFRNNRKILVLDIHLTPKKFYLRVMQMEISRYLRCFNLKELFIFAW